MYHFVWLMHRERFILTDISFLTCKRIKIIMQPSINLLKKAWVTWLIKVKLIISKTFGSVIKEHVVFLVPMTLLVSKSRFFNPQKVIEVKSRKKIIKISQSLHNSDDTPSLLQKLNTVASILRLEKYYTNIS